MAEVDKRQELSLREVELIRELAQIRKEKSEELEFEKFDGYELPPRTQFSMVKKPAVSIKYGEMTFNMACIRLFEGIHTIGDEVSFSTIGFHEIVLHAFAQNNDLVRIFHSIFFALVDKLRAKS